MKISTQPMENSQIALNVEMDAAEVEGYIEKAYHRLVKRVAVPGFRKGKTPRNILERQIGHEALLREALDDLLPESYKEALESQKIEAIDQPRIELLQTEPLTFKAVVPLAPTIILGDYKSIKVESKPVEIKDEDVDVAIGQLREQHATLLPVDRPAQFGDVVTMEVEGASEGRTFPIQKNLVYEVLKSARLPLPGFIEQLDGMIKGEEKSFVLSYPSDYEISELAGKDYSFKVKVTEVKKKDLPELDDEFARGLDSENVDTLRQRILEGLKARAEDRARMELEQKALEEVVGLSQVDYPPILVDREIDRLVKEEARHFTEGIEGLVKYLRSMDKTVESYREELRPQAAQRVAWSLVLEKIGEEEEIKVEGAEVDEEIEKMVSNSGEQAETMKKLFSLPEAREPVAKLLLNRKTMKRLVEIAGGSAS